MLGLDVDVSQWLPPDTMSHNFDNIANVQTFSPTLLQSYLDAADQISRLAVGDPHAAAGQRDLRRRQARPRRCSTSPARRTGRAAGLSVVHVFPADGTYTLQACSSSRPSTAGRASIRHRPPKDEKIEISIDGRRVALLPISPQMSESSRARARA